MVGNFTLYPLRQTPDIINPTNFRIDSPPIVLAPWGGVEFGGLPLTFQTTPRTSSTNVLLVIVSNGAEAAG